MSRRANALPRWLRPRATRLGAALVEGVIEVHGHRALLARLADASFGRALAAALALPDVRDLDVVARVLQGGLASDAARLGVVVDAARRSAALADGSGCALFAHDDDDDAVVRLHGRGPVVDVERRLGATLLVGHGARPFTSALLGQRGGPRGGRARVTVTLLASLIVDESAPVELMRLALGSPSGEPFGVPLFVYDDVLAFFEGMLHGRRATAGSRAGPLLALHDERARLEPRAARYAIARFARRELRHARDLGSRTHDDDARARPLPKRPPRTTPRSTSYQPRSPAPPAQRELFAP